MEANRIIFSMHNITCSVFYTSMQQHKLEQNIQGVPKVIVQRFGLIARPPFIRSAKFLRECFRKVAHSGNTKC